MRRPTPVLRAMALADRPATPRPTARRLARLAAGGLGVLGLVAAAAWGAHDALAADRSTWPARLVDAIAVALRAAWSP